MWEEYIRQGIRMFGPKEEMLREIADHLGLRQPQTSKHLKVLSDTGIVEVQAEANRRIYKLRPEPFQALDCWVQSFKRVMEERFDNLDEYLKELQNKEKS